MTVFDDVWNAAEAKARNPSRSTRIASSIKNKGHKWKKPGNVVKTVVAGLGALIPIPGVSIGTDHVTSKATDALRSRRRAHRRHTADGDLRQAVKFGIKGLDLSALDQSRRKAKDATEKFNKRYVTPAPLNHTHCGFAWGAAYEFQRARHRVDLLEAKAVALKAMADDILKWCDDLNDSLDQKEPNLKAALKDRLDHEPSECAVSQGNVKMLGGCFHAGESARWLDQFTSAISDST